MQTNFFKVFKDVPQSFDIISDPVRLAAVGEILPGQLGDPEFDRLTEMASNLLDVPTCLISLVTAESQNFKGACGLPVAIEGIRSTPLSHSFCKHTVISGQILNVEDALLDPRVLKNPIIQDVGLRAYLGFPLINQSGRILGAFCLIDYEPRKWTEAEIDHARNFAALAINLIESSIRQSRTDAALDVIAHDLKTPLSGISLSSAILKEQITQIPNKLHGMIDAIVTSTEDAVKILDAFTDLDHAGNETDCEDPLETMDAVVSRLSHVAEKKEMKINLSKGTTRPLAAPSHVIEQTLENLVSNALKYAPPGTSVWVSFDSDETHGEFRVRDEGPGFSEKDRTHIFQRYSRLSAKPTGDESSTGIGLSIVKRLTEQYGGSIDLISPPGKGAEFRLGFPTH